MKKVTPLSPEEIIVLLRDSKPGHTRLERTIFKYSMMNGNTLVSNPGLSEVSSTFSYFNIKVHIHSTPFIDESGEEMIGSFIYFVASEKDGIKYYVFRKIDPSLKYSLHFYNRLLERLVDTALIPIDEAIVMVSNYLAGTEFTINEEISKHYCLMDNHLVVFKSISNGIIELVTFLGSPLGEEQTRIYNALTNYKLTRDDLNKSKKGKKSF